MSKDIYDNPGSCLEQRNIGGWLIAAMVDTEGKGRIGIRASHGGDGAFAITWGYKTITAAVQAWYAWDIKEQSEPQGWAWKAGNQ